jgi:uncharacterized protein
MAGTELAVAGVAVGWAGSAGWVGWVGWAALSAALSATGAVAGLLAGLLGALGVSMHTAVGTGAANGTVISVPGAPAFAWCGWGQAALPAASLGYVNLLGVALIVPVTLLTTGWVVRAAHAVNPRTLRRLFALFLILTAMRMAWDLLD